MKVDQTVYKRGDNLTTTTITGIEERDGRTVVTIADGTEYTKAALVRIWSLVDQSL